MWIKSTGLWATGFWLASGLATGESQQQETEEREE